MKTALLLLLLSCFTLRAESLPPQEVVSNLIKAIQANELKQTLRYVDLIAVSQFPRHGMTPQEVYEMLQDISLPKSTLEVAQKNFQADSARVILRGVKSLDFDLRLVRATSQNQEDHYIVIAIHP